MSKRRYRQGVVTDRRGMLSLISADGGTGGSSYVLHPIHIGKEL